MVGVDVESFAIAGALVIFIIGLEMIIGREIMKADGEMEGAEIVPIAFSLIAGAVPSQPLSH
ncbi:MAG: MarC family protein [Saprospiraceae bacterium]